MLDFLALAQQCSPMVAPQTIAAVVKTESAFNPLAININGGAKLVRQPATVAEAAATARQLLASGASFDVGLGQINSTNFVRLGLTPETAFDPCTNLAAAGRVLSEDYARASARVGHGQPALVQALSSYNTGSPARGVANGYVGKVAANAGAALQRPVVVPPLSIQPGSPMPMPIPVRDGKQAGTHALPTPMPAPASGVARPAKPSHSVFASDERPPELVFR